MPFRHAKAEERKNDKYKDLVYDGYLFQPLAFEIQGAAGPSTEIFLSKLCKNLSICTEEPRAGSFLNQRISLAIQIANAACVLGTINDKMIKMHSSHLLLSIYKKKSFS